MNLVNKYNNCRSYFIGYFIFISLATAFLLKLGKANSFIYLNSFHSNWLDHFFTFYTYIGDGVFSIIISLLFLMLKRWKDALMIFLAYSLSGIASQIIKNLVIAPRPISYFKTGEYQHFIKGIITHTSASFPSGHTTSAFALSLTLALILQNKKWNIPLLGMAILTGYSRIYLGQHFLLDVIAGSILGTTFSVVVFHFMNKIKINNNESYKF